MSALSRFSAFLLTGLVFSTPVLAQDLAGSIDNLGAGGVGASQSPYGSVASANGVTVTTNIDNSRQIDSSSTISVTQTVNGENVAYGLNGAMALDDIDAASANAAAISAQHAQDRNNVMQALRFEGLINAPTN